MQSELRENGLLLVLYIISGLRWGCYDATTRKKQEPDKVREPGSTVLEELASE